MKTYKTFVPCLAMLLFLALACSNSSTSSTPTSNSSPNTSTPQDDAKKLAGEFWGKYAPLCGETSFVKSQDEGKFTELKGARFVVDFDPITEADRLNGIEVKGTTQLKSSSYRYFYDSEWHEWRTGTPQGMTYDAMFKKSNGKWIFEGNNYFKSFAREMTCKEVPTEIPD